ncbi:Na/Pi cotransporter family protein [Fuscibacter oryzae]|uniref:Na/Pi cotransporter family protein n=1 Tax=Fuscibacter oryzae TaxID=2803939 RepID=A0A8J7MWH8_9RHOB|nr:Na/Pi symporter [Fuscibacter oryzae]MBL4930130.1 Na/Pi cotransporter family protein [Fuscibacter oryzae]
MVQGWIGVLGGIGLFLFGMGVVTAALADLAGPQLRHLLGRATATPLRGALTGAVAATALQSTTAVLVMTIGFVSAGVLGFPQTIGVIAGASLGSTVGGWVITLMGLKLGLGTVAMPVLAGAALVALVSHERGGRLARLVAGLSLLFIGLQVMQGALSGGGMISAADLPQATGLVGAVLLLLIGAVVAMVIQSSNTGLALVMAMLGAGTLTLDQAAILVVGLNIGGPAAGMLAAATGGREGRMTALASVIMHAATGLVLFAAVPLLRLLPSGMDAQVALVVWDTVFNCAMGVLFLPWPHRFAALVQRIVPERSGTTRLDSALLADPGTALSAALDAASDLRCGLAGQFQAHLAGHPAAPDPSAALRALEDWLGQIRIPQGDGQRQCRTALYHLTDHLSRLAARLQEKDRLDLIRDDPGLARIARILAHGLASGRSRRGTEQAVIARAHRLRHDTLESEAAGNLPADQVFARTDALRWLERVADHAERITRHEAVARQALNG